MDSVGNPSRTCQDTVVLYRSLIYFIALEHFAFFGLESFLWTHPVGLQVFGQDLQTAQATQVLAMNQGLYNAFLAFGVLFAARLQNRLDRQKTEAFFLTCILIAGVAGGLTAKTSILWIQGLPAFLALILNQRLYRAANPF